jgi:hypothetical protein
VVRDCHRCAFKVAWLKIKVVHALDPFAATAGSCADCEVAPALPHLVLISLAIANTRAWSGCSAAPVCPGPAPVPTVQYSGVRCSAVQRSADDPTGACAISRCTCTQDGRLPSTIPAISCSSGCRPVPLPKGYRPPHPPFSPSPSPSPS